MLRALRRQPQHGRSMTIRRRAAYCARGTSSSSTDPGNLQYVEIGDVRAPITTPKSIELVPRGYMMEMQQGRPMAQTLLGHLRWMLQKDLLKQDMFLIGPPGSSRRLLSMRFCELLKKGVEYIAVSQDTTEADLKQRREIVNGAATFADQAPVRAAIHGRVLVIDGLEKAERNVLPTLNNLLENREMKLDDGRFLMKAESYDALVEKGFSVDALEAQNLVRVHPDFRVIGLGLLVPPYPGRTLDPPLRSRFQARDIQPNSPGSQLEELVVQTPSVPVHTLEKLVGIREAVNTIESVYDGGASTGPRMPHFDFLSLAHCAKLLEKFPHANVANAIQRSFPVRTDVLGARTEANAKALTRIVTRFTSDLKSAEYTLQSVAKNSAKDVTATVSFRSHSDQIVLDNIPCGTTCARMDAMPGFVETDTHLKVLAEMMQDHAVGRDLCVLGAKGSGKSALVRLFAFRLGYATELFSLFKDMTTRDLLQRRSTDSQGNTRWEDSPLIHAARNGHLCVLDGVHRLRSDGLGILQRLVQDREIDLADGSKLVSQPTYDAIVANANESGDVGALSRVSAIHPSFRIIAIAEADSATSKRTISCPGKESAAAWLNSDSISMFNFHHMPTLPTKQSGHVVRHLYPDLPDETTRILLMFSEKLKTAKKESANADHLALSLSTRQLLRICRHLNAFPQQSLQDLRSLLHDTLLTKFLSPSCSELVDSLLNKCKAPASKSAVVDLQVQKADAIREEEGRLYIGDVSYSIQVPSIPELVPQPHYFDIPKHTRCMQDMLQDIVAGQKHLLLIGNQGVGKNKLADRLLQLLQQEREYIQLHRDTTVQTLTLAPTLVDGSIVWKDSPLVRAAKTGRTLVVDEADKAPLEVVCVLKGLIEDGEMLLGNGKRLVDPTKIAIEEWHNKENIIELHPDFRMWVLANRPGFPFLGNNFFREIGDIFASHAIENPDEASELALLTAYAPNVPTDILRQLCKAFAELRDLVENGTITYPYSTREAVAVAKHLQRFPTDEVGSVLANVFAFDAYDRAMLAQVSDVFVRHGILLSSSREVSSLEMNITTADGSRVGGLSTPKTGLDAPKYGKEDPKNDPHVGGNTWAGGTGGSDTAGLGGRGGPYRLDKGHPVHQVSQAKKDEVSAAARAKAHAIAQEALADKLREIDMSDREWKTYESFLKRVERESSQLRAILANLETVTEERNWLRHQSSGELDDGKLVDGIAGEPLVFKRRGVSDSPFRASAGSSQSQDPKRMLFVMDVSGSMFRFNGQDARLERMLETSLMIMESFAGFERELDYSILGHSGDSPEIPFVEFGAPPKDRKERLQVLQRMVAHSQFCRSGDHTVEAIERGIQRVAALEGDERFVFVVSDANLERYGIEPRDLGRKLLADPSVQAHALFIASFADEAEQIRCALPNGRGHVCLETSDLPRTFKQIFTSALGSN